MIVKFYRLTCNLCGAQEAHDNPIPSDIVPVRVRAAALGWTSTGTRGYDECPACSGNTTLVGDPSRHVSV